MFSLIKSWKESVFWGKAEQAKHYFLLTLKTIIYTYKTLFYQFWWLLGLCILLEIISFLEIIRFKMGNLFYFPLYYEIIVTFFWFYLLYILYLIMRPSVKKKSFNYYKDYTFYFLYFICLLIITSLIMIGLAFVLKYFNFPSTLIRIIVHLLLLPFDLHFYFLWPLFIFMVLFFLDSQKRFLELGSALIRAIKMVIFNYPVCFLLFEASMAFLYLMALLIAKLPPVYFRILIMLLLPIPLAFWVNFYIRRVHEQFALYYPNLSKEAE